MFVLSTPAQAQLLPPATDGSIVDVCSGVSLPRSTVTGIVDDVILGVYAPTEFVINDLLGDLSGLPGVGALLPAPLSVNVTQLLTDAANGAPITLSVISNDGTLVGTSSQCDARADSYTLDNPAGIAIGGNRITGLGGGGEAFAADINAIAFGNGANTTSAALAAIALGSGASVSGANSVAIGSGASASAGNSVAVGAGSSAGRGAVGGVSVGEFSVGSAGAERQITNVADATQGTDAVNLRQLQSAIAGVTAGTDPNAVRYDSAAQTLVTLAGAGGTRVTNVADGSVAAGSSDAVNGSQLFATNSQVTNNTTAIANLQLQIDNIDTGGGSGGAMAVQYSNAATPTVPNGGTPTNDATLVGAAPGAVGLHNVGAGELAAGSTDAVNGGQLYATNQALASLGTDITNISGDITVIEGDIIDMQGDITVIEGDVSALEIALGDTNTRVDANTTAITNLQLLFESGSGVAGPLRYSDASDPTTPNDGTVTNDVTLVGADGPVTIHNVAAGEVSATSTDAVNGSQLAATNAAVATAQATADGAVVDAAAAQVTADAALELGLNSVQYADAAKTRLELGDGTTPVAVTNVADGTIAAGSTDAVNGGQLYTVAQNVANAVTYDVDDSGQRINRVTFNSGSVGPIRLSNVAAGTSANDAVNLAQLQAVAADSQAYTDLRFEQIAFDLATSIDDASAGTAAAMAHAGMPRAMDPGKVMIAGGFGVYRGESGFSLGSSYRSPDGDKVFNLGVSYDSRQRVGASGGFGIQF